MQPQAVSTYKALAAAAPNLGITVGDVKSSVELKVLPPADVQRFLGAALEQPLRAAGWHRWAAQGGAWG